MQTTSEHPTAANSSSHGRDEDGEGARVDYRPDLQAILRRPQKKFNAATSNNRVQMESEASELEESKSCCRPQRDTLFALIRVTCSLFCVSVCFTKCL